jgi:hypothetical protein
MGFLNSVRRFKLKKILAFLAAALLAAAFMGCSNDSDNNNSALLLSPSSGGSSLSSALPASVGTNELAGKKFSQSVGSTTSTYEFSGTTYKSSTVGEAVSGTYNTAYKSLTEATYSYSYDSSAKRIYQKLLGSSIFIIRDGKTTLVPNSSFSTDAQYVDSYKLLSKILFDKADDAYINSSAASFAKQYRYFSFSAFGYTDSTGETPVSDEIIARYNRAQELIRNSVSCSAYSLSSTGLKLVSDSGHYSKETKLSDFCYSFASHSFNLVANGSTAFTFSYRMQYAWPERYCALTASNGLWGYYVTSASESALSVSKVGARASSSSDYTFTEQASTISLSKSETSSYAVYTASLNGAVIGTITIPYATADNIPSFGTAGEYTLVQ